MRRILREVLYWTLALIFAGIMLVGFGAEIFADKWFGGLLKVVLAFIGYAIESSGFGSLRTRWSNQDS